MIDSKDQSSTRTKQYMSSYLELTVKWDKFQNRFKFSNGMIWNIINVTIYISAKICSCSLLWFASLIGYDMEIFVILNWSLLNLFHAPLAPHSLPPPPPPSLVTKPGVCSQLLGHHLEAAVGTFWLVLIESLWGLDHQGTSLAELRHVLDYQCHMGNNRGQRSFVNYVTFSYLKGIVQEWFRIWNRLQTSR